MLVFEPSSSSLCCFHTAEFPVSVTDSYFWLRPVHRSWFTRSFINGWPCGPPMFPTHLEQTFTDTLLVKLWIEQTDRSSWKFLLYVLLANATHFAYETIQVMQHNRTGRARPKACVTLNSSVTPKRSRSAFNLTGWFSSSTNVLTTVWEGLNYFLMVNEIVSGTCFLISTYPVTRTVFTFTSRSLTKTIRIRSRVHVGSRSINLMFPSTWDALKTLQKCKIFLILGQCVKSWSWVWNKSLRWS